MALCIIPAHVLYSIYILNKLVFVRKKGKVEPEQSLVVADEPTIVEMVQPEVNKRTVSRKKTGGQPK